MNPSAVFAELLQDRTITFGGGISVPTLIGGLTLKDAHEIGSVLAIYIGLLASALVCIYTAMRIIRLARDKAAKE